MLVDFYKKYNFVGNFLREKTLISEIEFYEEVYFEWIYTPVDRMMCLTNSFTLARIYFRIVGDILIIIFSIIGWSWISSIEWTSGLMKHLQPSSRILFSSLSSKLSMTTPFKYIFTWPLILHRAALSLDLLSWCRWDHLHTCNANQGTQEHYNCTWYLL